MSVEDPRTNLQHSGLLDETSRLSKRKNPGVASRVRWGWEILSSLCTLTTFAAIVAVLWTMDGRPLSQWQYRLSLNATIALLATLCTATMMHNVSASISQQKWVCFQKRARPLEYLELFDEASRGPFGSFVFLAKVKCNLATIGALITIFRLLFSPMVQAVIQNVPRNVTTYDSHVRMNYTHTFVRNVTDEETANTARSESP
jgi:hypothetical protein